MAAKDDIEGMVIDALPELDRFSGTYAIFDQAQTCQVYDLTGEKFAKTVELSGRLANEIVPHHHA